MSQTRLAERGAVALLTTIIIGILLSIITTGLITLMVSELRQSNDAEQSVRAYYAAQSGVEAGVGKVISALGNPIKTDQLCGTPGSKNVDLDTTAAGAVGWTCQQITYSGSPKGSISLPDKAVQVDVGSTAGGGPNFQSMKLEWDATPSTVTAGYLNAPVGNFPAAGGWSYAAPVELAIIDYPAAAFNVSVAGAVSLKNILTVPRAAGAGTVSYAAIKGSNPVQGNCVTTLTAARQYHCSLVITNLPNSNTRGYTFRLRTRYTGTDYRLTFYASVNGTGATVPVSDGAATIDITAKAGDVYRRVIYKVPYKAGAAIGLDYVLYSDTDICKNFGTVAGAIPATLTGCPY